jgi:hypothetical protein
MVPSHDDNRIGVTFGQKLILEKFYIRAILILKKNPFNEFKMERFINFDDDYYKEVCIQFHFSKKNPKELIFFKIDEIFSLDFTNPNKGKTLLYKLQNGLDNDPLFGVFSLDQTKCLIATSEDCLYVNIETQEEVDLD